MNVRNYLKCEVCGTITLVRTQIGYLDSHPIKVHCGKCGILISGMVFLNQQEGTFKFEFNNAKIVNQTNPDYYIESSGELLTEKLQKNDSEEFFYSPTPFFKSLGGMGFPDLQNFISKAISFLKQCDKDWNNLKRINELWLSGNEEYLKKEVNKYLPEENFAMNNSLECLRGVHQLNLIFFSEILDYNFSNSITNFILKEVDNFDKKEISELHLLVKEFEEKNLLNRYEEKIFGIIEQFIDKFKFIIPVFGLRFYKDDQKKNLIENKGITTASFEDLKQFYLDCFEVSGEIIRLVIAYNNLKYRQNYNKMSDKRRDIKSLSDFDEKSKGIKVGFIEGEEDFDSLIVCNLDNKLRNAIGHNSYKYYGAKQLLKYYPKGLEEESNQKTMTLLDFLDKC